MTPISILRAFLYPSPRRPGDSGPTQRSHNFRDSKVLDGLGLHPLTLLPGLPPPTPSHSEVAMLLTTLICWARLYFQEPFPQEPQAGRKSVIQSQCRAPQQKSEATPPIPTTRALPPGWKEACPHSACVPHRATWDAHSQASQ